MGKYTDDYYTERARLERAVQGLEEAGFYFENNPMPKTPKRITPASIRNLKKALSDLPKKAKFQEHEDINIDDNPVDEDTTILDNVREQINTWTPMAHWTPNLTEAKTRDKDILSNILNGAISQRGVHAVAKSLNEHALEVNTIIEEILYGSGTTEGNFKDGRTKVNADLVRFSSIVMGRALDAEESIAITEAVEENEIDY